MITVGGIEIDGLDEFQEMLEEMTLTEADERSSMRKAIKVIAEQVEKDTPVGETGQLSKIKTSVKKDGLGIVGVVKSGSYYSIFQEFGTSYQKANVGYFDRAVTSTQDEALSILIKELLSKAK